MEIYQEKEEWMNFLIWNICAGKAHFIIDPITQKNGKVNCNLVKKTNILLLKRNKMLVWLYVAALI